MGKRSVGLIRGSIPEWACSGASGSGDGYGYGYGSGSGYGYGYGSGSGDGDGDGSGSGDGDGDGSGDGDGDGHGYGHGYGSGSGYGYGDGYGDSDGSGAGYGYGYAGYWINLFRSSTLYWGDDQKKHLDRAFENSSILAFWRSDGDGNAANGGSGLAASAPGAVHTSEGPLSLCHKGTLHATMHPENWKGERIWIVALYGDVATDGEKYGALHREIIGELRR